MTAFFFLLLSQVMTFYYAMRNECCILFFMTVFSRAVVRVWFEEMDDGSNNWVEEFQVNMNIGSDTKTPSSSAT